MTFPYFHETEELTDSVRARASGSFVQLPDGICHYELSPPLPSTGEGPGVRATTIVLVHGFSVPYFIWDPTFEFLSKSGFRVLRFDLFGRGYSDRPHTRYGLKFYVRQLRDLLDALEIEGPVHLCGLSMGGPIVAAFSERFPGRAASLILVDPTGTHPIKLSPVLNLAKVPILAELVLGLAGNETLLRGIASDFFDPKLVDMFIAQYRPQMKIKGFKRAILSSLRENMLGGFTEMYRRVGALQKPTLLLWGRHDSTVPFEHSTDLRALLPNAEFHLIEDVGHIPHYEKAAEVNPILLNFLRQPETP